MNSKKLPVSPSLYIKRIICLSVERLVRDFSPHNVKHSFISASLSRMISILLSIQFIGLHYLIFLSSLIQKLCHSSNIHCFPSCIPSKKYILHVSSDSSSITYFTISSQILILTIPLTHHLYLKNPVPMLYRIYCTKSHLPSSETQAACLNSEYSPHYTNIHFFIFTKDIERVENLDSLGWRPESYRHTKVAWLAFRPTPQPRGGPLSASIKHSLKSLELFSYGRSRNEYSRLVDDSKSIYNSVNLFYSDVQK